MLGGKSPYGQLVSSETLGLENCTVPPLPETRYGHATFLTYFNQIGVCGGWWQGKPNSSDCLILNKTSGTWDRGYLGDIFGDGIRGVVDLKEHGVYLVHPTSTSFLAARSTTWIPGPIPPGTAECATKISDSNFVSIGGLDGKLIREYSPTKKEWLEASLWSELHIGRRGPGCAVTGTHLVVAGGVNGWQEVLTSVEVFLLESKAHKTAERMREGRAFFNLVPVGETHSRLLAIGGRNRTSDLQTTEWWDEEEDQWEEGPPLQRARSTLLDCFLNPIVIKVKQRGDSRHSRQNLHFRRIVSFNLPCS